MPFPVRVTDNVATARRLNVANRGHAAFLETLWPTSHTATEAHIVADPHGLQIFMLRYGIRS
jgi:hypothetical protein